MGPAHAPGAAGRESQTFLSAFSSNQFMPQSTKWEALGLAPKIQGYLARMAAGSETSQRLHGRGFCIIQ